MYLSQTRYVRRKLSRIFREGDGTGEGTGTPATSASGSPPSAVVTADTGAGSKTFDQAAVNLFVSREAEKWKTELAKVQAALKEQQSKTVPGEVRDALQKQIADMDAQLKTKEELAREAAQKAKAEYDSAVAEAQKEKSVWETKFKKMRMDNDVFAAVGSDAFQPADIVTLLGERLYLDAEEKTRVKFEKDGKELDLSATEAITLMKENPRFQHLFKSSATGGLGNQTAKALASKGNLPDSMKDVVAMYREIKKG